MSSAGNSTAPGATSQEDKMEDDLVVPSNYCLDIAKHYEIGKTIGSGGYGIVKRAKHRLTGHNVAIKM